jgi:uncharacterized membrane protein
VPLVLVAVLCTGLFAGAAIYITLVEHPARLACGTALAVSEFRPSYRRAAVMQGVLAAVGCAAALAGWAHSQAAPVLVAGILLGAAIPFTLVVVRPTNTRLMNPALDRDSDEAAALLARWGNLHAVRSVASGAAFLLLTLHMAGTL